ncbi:MAG: tRNA preQ1(34) S-adenosylmethionine ribosyltransferase-isomerase QueA [Coriobacteriia bacterium]|nr:tRNA preQ1(34) S-adenosylmethionine ribosyltransferase-isomerase QueA [Coriobacteriia bacterium]
MTTDTPLRTEDFNYHLPEHLIAQEPMMPRDACKLLVMNRSNNKLEHRHFRDIGDYLNPDDLLVVNETRVLPARLQGRRADTGGAIEVLLLKDLKEGTSTCPVWECLAKPGKRVKEGTEIVFGEGENPSQTRLTGKVISVGDNGIRHISFSAADDDFHAAIHRLGTLPLPPYIKGYAGDQDMYQTVYAGADEHSAAAPTAGLHFTPELLDALQTKGVNIARVRLDVGLDTFRPVSEDDPAQHHIHTEYFHVPQEAADAVNTARAAGGRVIAVGTTVVRALESAAQLSSGAISEQGAPTSLYILPGFEFKAVDALITNFHVPKSTLVMMISAFTGREEILAAYNEAVQKEYRFLSFGDAMLIL